MTAFLALAGALILAGVATFGYFGGYWWQYWQQIRDTADAPERPHWMETNYCNRCGVPHLPGNCLREDNPEGAMQ